MHRLGAPSSAPASAWSRKPQSMQAMAPGSRAEPHAGQAVGAGGLTGTAPDGFAAGGGEGGVGLPAGRAAPAAAPAATGSRAGALPTPPTWNRRLPPGQRTCLPGALSGTCIALVQWGQRMVRGIGAPHQYTVHRTQYSVL